MILYPYFKIINMKKKNLYFIFYNLLATQVYLRASAGRVVPPLTSRYYRRNSKTVGNSNACVKCKITKFDKLTHGTFFVRFFSPRQYTRYLRGKLRV
ncbi:hypothetical protein Glove_343g24 [Diversispora epigaea]|uniref:Uncharacterized protein n=1 Tax=Diversispora epigaea TaxID=1348612 RepID=A0A397HGT7_9GLOM|nr:hypothetical protein Glove_343g24 [Diversispora epigaea]